MTASLRSLAHTLGGQTAGRDSVLCPGPGHSRRDRSLKVKFKPDGTFTVTSFSGDDWQQCKDYVRERLGLPNDWRRHDNDDQPVIHLRERHDDEAARIRSALKRWETSVLIAGTPAEAYLRKRGVSYDGDAIRYRPNDGHLYCLMTDIATNSPTGVQATHIDKDGNPRPVIINGEPRKRTTHGRAHNSVVRLTPDEDVHYGLAIAEGVVTALAVPFRPVWACLSAGTMERFPVLPVIQALTIFADNDASGAGQRAANECGRRWFAAGREIEINLVAEIGADFADVAEVA